MVIEFMPIGAVAQHVGSVGGAGELSFRLGQPLFLIGGARSVTSNGWSSERHEDALEAVSHACC